MSTVPLIAIREVYGTARIEPKGDCVDLFVGEDLARMFFGLALSRACALELAQALQAAAHACTAPATTTEG